jgi:MYXO-CTERM domain-containing protein
MTCQQDCQEEEFESCEYELRADCDASCEADGALFCDGEFVMAGPELQGCMDALVAHGVMEVEDAVEDALDDVKLDTSATGCTTGNPSTGGLAAVGLFMLALFSRRRR